MPKNKRCYQCGHDFPREELSNNGYCRDCSVQRLTSWLTLQRQAHDQWWQEHIDGEVKKSRDENLKKLLGE